jgi:hypothetical protein
MTETSKITSKQAERCVAGIIWLTVGLCCVLYSGHGAFAQADMGTITGVVRDSSGEVVPSAGVTLTNELTGVARTTETNSKGIYVAPNLVIGRYTLRASAPGFKTFIRTGIVLNVVSTVNANALLTVGMAKQTVVVRASPVQVQSKTSDTSTIISATQISEIPTDGRNIYQLAELVPGASSGLPMFDAPDAVDLSDSIYINGDKRRNLYLINGGEEQDGGCTGCMSTAPSQNAIAEARIITGNAQADIGLNSGAVEDFSTKSGTSQFHGQLWEFNRNDAFDANDFFANLSGTPKPELRYNLFGFNMGGPVYIPGVYKPRQKTFFFYNMEWRRLAQGSEIYTFTMPSETFQGNFSGLPTIKVPETADPAEIAKFASYGLAPGEAFPNNTIPGGLIDPNAALLLKAGILPQPNTPDGTHYSTPAPSGVDVREEVIRLDHRFNHVFSFMGSMLEDDAQIANPTPGGGDTYPTVAERRNSPSYSGQFRLTETFRSNLLNETSFNIDELGESEVPTGDYAIPTGYSAVPYFTGVNADNRIPQISIGEPYGVTYTTRDLPYASLYHNNQIEDDLTWIRGKHELGFGASYMWALKKQNFSTHTQGDYSFSGAFSGNAFADFLLGYAANYYQAVNQSFVDVANHRVDLYAKDNWTVTPRFTLNLGLRWDFVPHGYDINGAMSTFIPADYNRADAPIFNADGSLDSSGPGFTTVTGVSHAVSSIPFYLNGVALAGRNGEPKSMVETDYDDLAPRIGFAYALTGDSKTVLRGGFGMFYEQLSGNDIYDSGTNPPFSYVPSANNVFFSDPATSNVTGLTAAQPIFPASLQAISYHYPLPTSMQYNLGVERQLSPTAVLGVSYVGTFLYNQTNSSDVNTVPLDDPNRLAICGGSCGYTGPAYNANLDRNYPGFSDISYEFGDNYHADYNSLQTTLLIHARRNLNFTLAYTWSHAIDYGSGDGSGFSDPYNFSYDRGSADYDRRHVVQISYFYSLPFFHSGAAFGSGANRFVRATLGGWQLSGVTTFETGNPNSIYLGYDNTGLGGNETSRADIIGPIRYSKAQLEWFDPSSFAAPPPLVFGDSGRNIVYGPGLNNWDIALSKVFPLWGEGKQFQFRFEAYNAFNSAEFNGINTSFSSGPGEFGTVTSAFSPRVLQLGGQITW